jgi:hypothetical protein
MLDTKGTPQFAQDLIHNIWSYLPSPNRAADRKSVLVKIMSGVFWWLLAGIGLALQAPARLAAIEQDSRSSITCFSTLIPMLAVDLKVQVSGSGVRFIARGSMRETTSPSYQGCPQADVQSVLDPPCCAQHRTV